MLLFASPGRRAGRSVVGGMVVLAVVALVAGSSRAAEVTAVPSADTFVAAAEPTYNYGAAGAVEVSGAGTPSGQFQGLVRFDPAEAKARFDAQFGAGGWKLDSATLRLSTSNPNNTLFNPNAAGSITVSWMQNDAWVEGTGGPITPTTDGVTFNTLPTFLSPADESMGTINFPGGTSGANSYSLSLSPGFTTDLLTGSSASLRFYVEGGGSTSYLFASRTFNQTANRPVLTLSASAVPEPSVGIGLVGLAGMLLRRRARRA